MNEGINRYLRIGAENSACLIMDLPFRTLETEEAAVVVKNETSLLDIQLGASFDTFSVVSILAIIQIRVTKMGRQIRVDKKSTRVFHENMKMLV